MGDLSGPVRQHSPGRTMSSAPPVGLSATARWTAGARAPSRRPGRMRCSTTRGPPRSRAKRAVDGLSRARLRACCQWSLGPASSMTSCSAPPGPGGHRRWCSWLPASTAGLCGSRGQPALSCSSSTAPTCCAPNRSCLTASEHAQPARSVFLSTDLNRNGWQGELLSAGLDASAPTAWLAEGFLFYLPSKQITALLSQISELAPIGSSLGFDVINSTVLTHRLTRAWVQMQADAGAPWAGSLDDPVGYLATLGWRATLSQCGAADSGSRSLAIPGHACSRPGPSPPLVSHPPRRLQPREIRAAPNGACSRSPMRASLSIQKPRWHTFHAKSVGRAASRGA